jgi:hypothetical protein
MFGNLKSTVEKIYGDITGEARRDVEAALADVEARVAKLNPVLNQAVAEVKTALVAAEPEIKAAAEKELEALVTEVTAIFQ